MQKITALLLILFGVNITVTSQRIISEELDLYLIKIDSNAMNNILGKNFKEFSLTPNDLKSAEQILQIAFLKAKNDGSISNSRNINTYGRQYFSYLDNSGDRIVWINCFMRDKSMPKQRYTLLYFVKDGGDRYFNIKINLTTKKSYDLNVNGES